MGMLTTIRDEVYLRIETKRLATDFYYANNFVVEKTWRPWETIEDLADSRQFPSGKLYIIGGRPGDIAIISRSNMTLREYPVGLGFQKWIANTDDTSEIDSYVNFIEELEETCRLQVDSAWNALNWPSVSFSRLEPMRDPNGVPYSFVGLRDNIFESYFTAFFTSPLSENVATTTTTTT